MKTIMLAIIALVLLVVAGLGYRQYISYQECKAQSRQAALFTYPNDPEHPEYTAKRKAMEANFITVTCHKFAPNLGT